MPQLPPSIKLRLLAPSNFSFFIGRELEEGSKVLKVLSIEWGRGLPSNLRIYCYGVVGLSAWSNSELYAAMAGVSNFFSQLAHMVVEGEGESES
jgi:hypothetical protein